MIERDILTAFSRCEIGAEEACAALGLLEVHWRHLMDRLVVHGLPYPHPAARDPDYETNLRRVEAALELGELTAGSRCNRPAETENRQRAGSSGAWRGNSRR